MTLPGRTHSSTAYRYGFQGQEKDDELKGEGNSLNYKYRMHDPRVGRFFAVDPLESKYPWYSPYQFGGNSPIMSIELEGLEESTTVNENQKKPSLVEFAENKNRIDYEKIFKKAASNFTPGVSIHIGETGGPWGGPKRSTSLFNLYGGKENYNSSPNGRDENGKKEFLIDEPNSFLQVQIRIGGKESNKQIGVNWFKQKYHNDNGFGFEAPTSFQASYGINNLNLFKVGKIAISSNLSFGAGIVVGMPRYDFKDGIFNDHRLLGTKYSIIGYGATIINRVDIAFTHNLSLFIAGSINHTQTLEQTSNIGKHPGEAIGTGGFMAGVGFNIGCKRR